MKNKTRDRLPVGYFDVFSDNDVTIMSTDIWNFQIHLVSQVLI